MFRKEVTRFHLEFHFTNLIRSLLAYYNILEEKR
jgi:hypothetical protein